MTLLEISELTLDLPNGSRLLDGISLRIEEGETVGLVGESGSGKSLTARAVIGLLPDQARTTGSVRLGQTEVLGASVAELLELRRHTASMIFQDPRAGINPMRTIGDHLTEALRLCEGKSAAEANARAKELLAAVRLPRPEDHMHQHPHELSGGMLQRVMIAGALTSSPQLLICDEPTTALDVTTQAEIVAVLSEQRASRGMGMLFITHDLNLAASLCDRVYVMSGGKVEEHGTARAVFGNPQTPYTRRLIEATPSISLSAAETAALAQQSGTLTAAGQGETEPMLAVEGLSKSYRRRGKATVDAVKAVSVSIPRGGALGVVGESGSGKSTLARMIVGLESADAGGIRVDGRDRTTVPRTRAERLAHARSVQMVFQDPYLSLDPRIAAGRSIEDALRLHGTLDSRAARSRVLELLDQVGLAEQYADARPRTLSGGQRQRVAIARALAIEPDVLVMDEATSALDVSVQAQVLDLVADIRKARGLTVLFISHDLAVVRRVCDETVVMKAGEIVERGQSVQLLAAPQHPYTRLLLDSIPRPAWESDPRESAAANA
ncbi:dipeptide ABC transporter ATP-binding protein [Microterricola pindariensis]|uniref:ABC transporter ATP-binding protein n=1 Tax=Microterricola pindariensis TaxID=478010 RepID=A0ABX5AST1_9MICO|nr:ABC transporter ATP-binding protein [Microterricola pindariensis]PPL15508.1 ABC transporter ATP-binding protein [Microterricola pindariensis]